MNIKQHLRMTASEIAMGRYMRAPDHAAAADAGQAEFDAAFSAESLKDVVEDKGAIGGGGDGAAAAAGAGGEGAAAGAAAGGDGAGAASGDAAGAAADAGGDQGAAGAEGAAAAADDAAGAAVDGKGAEGAAASAGGDAGGAAGGDAGTGAAAADGGATGKDGAPAAVVPDGPDADEIIKRLAAEVAKQPKADAPVVEAPAAEAPPLFDEAETASLAKFREDWPEEAKAVELMQRELGRGVIQYVFDQIAPEVKQLKDLVQTLAYRAQVGDITTGLGEYPTDEEIDQTREWVKTQPAYLQAGMNGVIDGGTADDVVDLVTRYREATGKQPAGAQVDEPKPQGGDTELSEQAKQAAAALAPVGSQRTAVQSPEDASNFDAGWAKWVDQPV